MTKKTHTEKNLNNRIKKKKVRKARLLLYDRARSVTPGLRIGERTSHYKRDVAPLFEQNTNVAQAIVNS